MWFNDEHYMVEERKKNVVISWNSFKINAHCFLIANTDNQSASFSSYHAFPAKTDSTLQKM